MRKKKQQKNTSETRTERLSPDVLVAEQEKKSRHILAKLLCLIAAICVWLYVMNQESEGYERTFAQIPVLVDGVSSLNAVGDMSVISGYDNTIDVTVVGKKSEVQALTPADIRASVDVSRLNEAGRHTLMVTVQLPDHITQIGELDITADVYVDTNTTREVPVRIINLDYIINSSYTFGTPVLSREVVTVTGPQLVLDSIDCAGLSFNLGNVTTSTTMVGSPTLLDAEGVAISNPYIRCDVTEITVEIPVIASKQIPLTATYAAPALMSMWAAEITPALITVCGDPLVLANLNELSVYTINMDAKEGEYVISSIELPEGVTMGEKTIADSIYVRIRRSVG